ncbi:MAG: antitoxin family protein [Scytonema hyalinum WJT4-NPBG1]|jgi:predicted DNA-binding antitoxin AbrB/MazE fold protein|nr:antitoxin family protein [Scytonema hyalinum WJT4-NPBG1]
MMMQQTLDAIYENGVFRPLKSLKISEGQKVKLTAFVTS